jgi:hypothetical protein
MVRGGNKNILQGDFGETWLHAVASALELDHGRPGATDLDKADVEIARRGLHWGTYSPTVKAQVKTVTGLRHVEGGDFVYDLDIETYDVLRRTDHATRRVLVVVDVRDDGKRIRVSDEGITLLGCGYWVSLEGFPPSENKRSIAIDMPKENRLDEEGVMRMLERYGVRMSTIVPDFDPWEVKE